MFDVAEQRKLFDTRRMKLTQKRFRFDGVTDGLLGDVE